MSHLNKGAPMFDPFEEFNRFFSDGTQAMNVTPAVDVYQTDDAVIVEAPMPGIDPVKADIAIENDVLTIKAESEQKSEVEEKNYYRKEIRTGSFYRTIPLPTHVVGDKASATYENGVLKVSVPKAPEVKAKTIKVNVK